MKKLSMILECVALFLLWSVDGRLAMAAGLLYAAHYIYSHMEDTGNWDD